MAMYKGLQLDIDGFMVAFNQEMIMTANRLIKDMEADMRSQAKLSKAKGDSEVEQAREIVAGLIEAQLTSFAWAIVDSFGTGSKMVSDNEALQEYMNSEYWNPLRTGKAIVGRPEGTYTNIFGEEVYSSGNKAGKPVNIPTIKPSHAIQTVEALYFSNRIELRLSQAVQNFLNTRMFDFWKYE